MEEEGYITSPVCLAQSGIELDSLQSYWSYICGRHATLLVKNRQKY